MGQDFLNLREVDHTHDQKNVFHDFWNPSNFQAPFKSNLTLSEEIDKFKDNLSDFRFMQ